MQARAPHAADLRHGVATGDERGVMKRPHRLERDDARLLRGFEDPSRLVLVRGERLLDEHVLAAGDARERLLGVKRIRAADVDGVDLTRRGEVFERGERVRAAALGCERLRAPRVARERAHEDGVLARIDLLDEIARDRARADSCDT